MQFKTLGRSDLAVTDICLGTMTWGSQNDEAEGHAQIAMARDAGINFMDTAEMYAVPASPGTSGRTETIIGNWFAAHGDRDKWVLATKMAGGGNAHIRNGAVPDRHSVREALEASLKRLRTDHVDLYQIHWASRGHYNFENYWTFAPHGQETARALDNIAEVLAALGDLVREGKIRHIGLSNETTWGLTQWLRLAEQNGLPRIVSIQNEYSLLRRIFDHDLAELSHHEQVGLLAYSPLAAGLLTGKYFDDATPRGSRREYQKGFWRLNAHSDRATRDYHALAARHGLDPVQMAIAFCRSRPFMASTIIGATSTTQLRQVLGAADLELSPEVLADIDAIHRANPRPI
ncbi:aldo/keto reductase [Devosia faecipullorum]|uniref:aldo/keto reductase n=1 Tax=Devosia faecipullorum TaxID=2755039 RepID=UPI00187BBC80|nr:aldo/keto reductase [Devosia faecipullorum]MBE7733019.1 aldo/keto reductase [Devosia faecipullorum]